jgi:hypothetical protein
LIVHYFSGLTITADNERYLCTNSNMLKYLLSPEGFFLSFLMAICGVTVLLGVVRSIKESISGKEK